MSRKISRDDLYQKTSQLYTKDGVTYKYCRHEYSKMTVGGQ